MAGDITGVRGIFCHGKGRLAGGLCESLGYYEEVTLKRKDQIWDRLNALRTGPLEKEDLQLS